MKVLVTGATGFVGAAVARALNAAGMEVRVLVRRDSDLRNLSHLKVEQAYGDLRDRASLRRALYGASCRDRQRERAGGRSGYQTDANRPDDRGLHERSHVGLY